MSALPDKRWTPQEYLAFERASQEKHEYLAGDVVLMTRANRKHNLITANVITILNTQFRGRPCEAYASDMRVRISAVNSYTYPDIAAVCEPPEFEDAEMDTLLNPAVIIEVLSPSTEKYDRGKKFQDYRTLPSLREYLLVSQNTARVEHYIRQGDNQWLLKDVTGLDAAAELTSVGCVLTLAEVYDKVTFDEDME